MTSQQIKTKLFEVRDVIHDLHLDTSSYAEHKALGGFYEAWTGLMDTFLETFMGKYGRIKGFGSIDINTDINKQSYLISLAVFLNTEIITIVDEKTDTDLCNTIADMKQLVNSTLYLLTLK